MNTRVIKYKNRKVEKGNELRTVLLLRLHSPVDLVVERLHVIGCLTSPEHGQPLDWIRMREP